MATVKLIIERSKDLSGNRASLGIRLRCSIDPLVVVDFDQAVFIYECIPFGNTTTSVFIGVASPSDLASLPIGEPIAVEVGDKFRMTTVDIVLRSTTLVDMVVDFIRKDLEELLKLNVKLDAVPSGLFEVIIT